MYEEYIYANNRWELLGNTKVDLSEYAKISQLPTKLSDLMQDIDYALKNELSLYVEKYKLDENPTTLSNGIWKFRLLSDSELDNLNVVSVNFIDSDGNSFKGFGKEGYDSLSMDLVGILNNGKTVVLYSKNNTGLVFNENGILRDDYYLIFEERLQSDLQAISSFMIKYSKIDYATEEFVDEKINESIKNLNGNNGRYEIVETNIDESLAEGIWKFDKISDFGKLEFFSRLSFTDSLQNSFGLFSTISGEVRGDSIYGVTNENNRILIYNPTTRTGLAFNEDGSLRDDYYLKFEEDDIDIKKVLILTSSKYLFSEFATEKYVDSEYISKYVKQNNPTTLLGRWVFKDNVDLTQVEFWSSNLDCVDSLGNRFTDLTNMTVPNHPEILVGYIDIENSVDEIIYNSIDKTGLAFENKNYYLTFKTEPTNSNLLDTMKVIADKYEIVKFATEEYVNENIPIKISQLENDKNFIDSTVNNLTNYYLKSETYTQAEVKALINSITSLSMQVVDILPVENISSTTIYLLLKADSGETDVYDEYVYINNRWELIGDTQINLSNVVTTNTDQEINGKKTFNKPIVLIGDDAYGRIYPSVNNTGLLGIENNHFKLAYINDIRIYSILPTLQAGGGLVGGVGSIGNQNYHFLNGYIDNIYSKSIKVNNKDVATKEELPTKLSQLENEILITGALTLKGTWYLRESTMTKEIFDKLGYINENLNFTDSLGNKFISIKKSSISTSGGKYVPEIKGTLEDGTILTIYYYEDSLYNSVENYHLTFETESSNSDVLMLLNSIGDKGDKVISNEEVKKLLLNKADKTEIPTKVSQLENDSNYTNQSDLEALTSRVSALESSSGGVLNQVFAYDSEGNKYEVYGYDENDNKYLVMYEEVA